MTRYYALREDGRIGMTSDAAIDGAVEMEFPEGFDFERQSDWRVADGALVYEPLPENDTPPVDYVADLAEMVIDLAIEVEILKLGGLGDV